MKLKTFEGLHYTHNTQSLKTYVCVDTTYARFSTIPDEENRSKNKIFFKIPRIFKILHSLLAMKGAMCIHNILVLITQNTFLCLPLKFSIYYFFFSFN